MKWSALFFLASGVYVAPHMSKPVALACGAVAFGVALYALWKGD